MKCLHSILLRLESAVCIYSPYVTTFHSFVFAISGKWVGSPLGYIFQNSALNTHVAVRRVGYDYVNAISSCLHVVIFGSQLAAYGPNYLKSFDYL